MILAARVGSVARRSSRSPVKATVTCGVRKVGTTSKPDAVRAVMGKVAMTGKRSSWSAARSLTSSLLRAY